MDLKKEYDTLFQHWLREAQELKLTTLSQSTFESYKKSFEFIDVYKLNSENDIQKKMLMSYKENFHYLFSDFLKLREIKIINAAISLQEINFDNVIEAEKLFYKNIVSSIKGFKKIRDLSVDEVSETVKINDEVDDLAIKKTLKHEKLRGKNHLDIGPVVQEIISPKDTTTNEVKENYDYTLVRFLKKTPPLVGVDLKNYGPFDKENVALIPYKNAIILLSEKFAEKIDLS